MTRNVRNFVNFDIQLLDPAADPNARTETGETPSNLAQENDAPSGTDALQRLTDSRF